MGVATSESGGAMSRTSERALATTMTSRPCRSASAASSLLAMVRGSGLSSRCGRSRLSGKRSTASSPTYDAAVRANASAASSPGMTTKVGCGFLAKRAATNSGRAEETTPRAASLPPSSFPQKFSTHPDLSRMPANASTSTYVASFRHLVAPSRRDRFAGPLRHDAHPAAVKVG